MPAAAPAPAATAQPQVGAVSYTHLIISPDIHELGITLREFNEKIFSAADSVMIGLMTRQNRSAESRA